jgi:NAD(P)-dependent dehydrogenase (short-subunit alcohol dehydrogenase family)
MSAEDDQIRARIEDAAALLESILEDRGVLSAVDSELRKRLLMVAGKVARPDAKARRQLKRSHQKREKMTRRTEDRALLSKAGIRRLRENPIFQTPRRNGAPDPLPGPIGDVHDERVCYVCRARFNSVHFFYDQMCQTCGDFNYGKRDPQADLSGRVAMVTGSRVKIGFQAAVLLLRSGCRVLCTTRFPKDAAVRYAALPDFEDWSDRLEVHGIDLRRVGDVEVLCETLNKRLDRLDFVIHNACQTVRRPPGFYDHLMRNELTDGLDDRATSLLAPREAGLESARWSQVPLLAGDAQQAAFPIGKLDADLQQVDLRTVNSWRLQLDEVPTVELLEVQLVNAVAPFVMNARLKGLMARSPGEDHHIVNVSAMEGQFYRTFKSDRHPHTNMAKAALNMMTRTSAADYVQHGIHMNSVDTGWVTDEDPVHHAQNKTEMHGFHPPLDIVDGAARIVDPIFDGLNTGKHTWGQFLKDYKPTDW